MRPLGIGVILLCLVVPVLAQNSVEGPTDKKAQKSYQEGLEHLQKNEGGIALWYFRDADKKDQGHCLPCHEQMVKLGLALKDWKAVEDGALGLASEVREPKQQAVAHYYLGMALMNEGINPQQTDLISRAHEEFSKALSLYSGLSDAVFQDGRALAQLHRDTEAKAQFTKFVAMTPPGVFERWRAQQFIEKPELARAKLVPNFTAFTADGRRISVRDLAGKVVLVHFWATTCGTCPRDFPRLRAIAKKFENAPFVILSISTDYQPAVWRSFLEKNDVPGLQCMEGYNGPIAQAFGIGVQLQQNVDNPVGGAWVSSWGMKQDLPKTFTIDAEGVLRGEKFSESLESRLQELIARASTNPGSSSEMP